MWNSVSQIAYFRIPNLVLTLIESLVGKTHMVLTLIDSLVVHVGKTHVFVIMTMNNGKRRGPRIVAPLCKKSSLVVNP